MRIRALSFVLALAAAGAVAQPAADPSPHSEAALVTGAASVRPGGSVEMALRLRLDDGWHAYWLNPGDSGLPVAVEWTLPEGATAGPLRFPAPKRYTLAGLTSYAHEGEAYFFSTVAVPDGLAGPLVLAGEATWLVCADVCLPARERVALTIPLGDGAGRTAEAAALDAARARLPRAAEGWTATAARTDGGYLLTVAPPPGVDLDGAMFFPSEAPVLNHAADQAFTRESGAWAVRLDDSDYAERPAERLRGVLVAASGEAVEIDAAVASDAVASGVPAGSTGGGSLAWMLLLALGGGMLLNLMPCVFPVLSLKVLGIAQGGTARDLRRHGLAFGAGVVVSFLALAGLLLSLRAGGAALGWGFQLQSPPVVAALAALMVVLALGLFGVVEMGASLASSAARADRAGGLGGAFASGVLATAVASPCTAPMMGAALGWALAQPTGTALAVFAALGVGMALPFVALSFAPGLAARLPRPGPWMETLKQALAFPLLATAVWLVWVFGRQTGTDGAAALLLALVALGFGVWVLGRYPSVRVSTRVRLASRLFVALVVAGAVALVGFATGAGGGIAVSGGTVAAGEAAADGWQPYATERVERLVAEGTPVFVDYTAAWCLTCQVNKRTTLRTASVERAFAEAGVVRVEADWTDRSEEIERSLARFGRSGVPLYVLYPGGGAAPVVLPEVLTPGIVLAALADAGRGTRSAGPE